MNKKEASEFLKELLTECKLDSNSFDLMAPIPGDALSAGYKIRIKAILEKDSRDKLKVITKKFDLAVIEEDNQIIVYKPKLPAGNLIIK